MSVSCCEAWRAELDSCRRQKEHHKEHKEQKNRSGSRDQCLQAVQSIKMSTLSFDTNRRRHLPKCPNVYNMCLGKQKLLLNKSKVPMYKDAGRQACDVFNDTYIKLKKYVQK